LPVEFGLTVAPGEAEAGRDVWPRYDLDPAVFPPGCPAQVDIGCVIGLVVVLERQSMELAAADADEVQA